MTAWHGDRFKVNFLARIDVQEDGCWLWTGGGSKERYGRFYAGDIRENWAHRNAWRLHHGRDIPAGIEIHHTCETPKCVNPLHLEALTPAEHDARHVTIDRPHGLSKYRREGCRCEVCQDANRAARHQYLARVRAEAAAGLRPIPHGTKNGYGHYGCRCDECRAASTAEQRQSRSRTGLTWDEWNEVRKARHGTTSMYTKHGCRCDECRANWSEYWKAYRLRKRERAVAS